MAFKFIILAALVATVSAGGPAAYSIAAPSADFHSVGASHEHTVKGLYGQNVLSQYSKAVDSAHSSVRVHSSRLSNDGYALAAPAVKYAAPAYAAHYGAPAVHYPAAAHYAAPAVHYGAPAAYAAPAVHYAAHAPIVKAAYPAAYPAAYSAAPLAYKAPLAAPVAAVHGGAVVQFAGLGASYAW
ncbi:cuticle protein 21.3-like [Anopheles aquasalis]|uniref:cuticle protein 21.3-like n=1 Tax=Anopheles aquasalis TaxID=42839 RepID=UPI00215A9374|nr:cuticle protein 21.3-like [Anopheles aquasalis]